MTTMEAPPAEVVRDSHDEVLAALAVVATECLRLRGIIRSVQEASGVEFARIEMHDPTQQTVDEHGKARVGFTVSVVGGDEVERARWVAQQFADFFNSLIVENVGRAEKAEKDLQHMLDVGRQEYAEAYAAPIRERAEKAEKERDEERRQRIHEAELASDAIVLVRRLAEQAIPTLDDCTCPTRGAGGCDVCERREAMAAARAWLDERAKV